MCLVLALATPFAVAISDDFFTAVELGVPYQTHTTQVIKSVLLLLPLAVGSYGLMHVVKSNSTV